MEKELPICPRCNGFIPSNENAGAYAGAISRRDNKTEICSACGVSEAFEDFLGLTSDEPTNPAKPAVVKCKHCATVIHPSDGVWVDETDGDGCLQLTPHNAIHEPLVLKTAWLSPAKRVRHED